MLFNVCPERPFRTPNALPICSPSDNNWSASQPWSCPKPNDIKKIPSNIKIITTMVTCKRHDFAELVGIGSRSPTSSYEIIISKSEIENHTPSLERRMLNSRTLSSDRKIIQIHGGKSNILVRTAILENFSPRSNAVLQWFRQSAWDQINPADHVLPTMNGATWSTQKLI